jgi:hypothetical protein
LHGDFRFLTFQIGTRPVAQGDHMRKSFIGLAAAASLGLATLAAPGPANAGCFGCAVGAGVLGGVLLGTAIANAPPPAYYPPPPPPGYYPPPPGAYAAPPPAYAQLAPGCHWGRHKIWVDGYGYQWQTVQVCP